MFDRQLPFSLEAEQAVLGSILIDPVSLDTIHIQKEDFYIPEHAAKRTGKTVCVFSLEMSAEQLINRMMSSEACVPSHVMRTGGLTTEQANALAYASGKLAETHIMIDDTPGISVGQIKSRLCRVKDLELVVIDYLQLMQSDNTSGNRVQEVEDRD